MEVRRIQNVQACLDLFKAPQYLGIEVWKGRTLFLAGAPRIVSVNLYFAFDVDAAGCAHNTIEFLGATSDDYFLQVSPIERIDAAYIDCFYTLEIMLLFLLNMVCFPENASIIVGDCVVVPLAPGVPGEGDRPENYEVHNFSTVEITLDLRLFATQLRSVNPMARIILTVSSVPLIATYEDRHVLVSTTGSKSTLRVAAAAASQGDPLIDYFPSYETISGAYNRGAYFAHDLRSVTPEGVGHVIRVFLRHYPTAEAGPQAVVPEAAVSTAARGHAIAVAQRLVRGKKLLDVSNADNPVPVGGQSAGAVAARYP